MRNEKMQYKYSIYNHFGELRDGSILVYNVLSSAVAIYSKEEFSAIHQNTLFVDENDLFQTSIELGFVVPKDEDELAKVLALRNSNNYNDRFAGFQILPTTGCNARCFYCYEHNFAAKTMSKDILDSTVRFILDYCENMQEVNIAWFGGEPLTCEKHIAEISQKLTTEFDKRGISYTSDMITNGALISEDNIDAIVKDYRISSIQITLDGQGYNHITRKGFIDKSITYQRILNNIALLTKKNVHVNVRINVDRVNIDDCLAIFDDLANLDANFDNLWPYVAPLYSYQNNPNPDCFEPSELDMVFAKVYKKMIDTGFIQTVNGLPMNFTSATCCAKMLNNFVISPDGSVSKCEHMLDLPEEVIGHVSTGICFNSAMTQWTDPNVPEKCRACSYLPICQTGCLAAEKCGFGFGRCSYITFVHNAIIEAANYLIERGEKHDNS